MKKITLVIAASAIFSASTGQAAMLKDGVWKVQAGDSMESILQTVLPKDKARHKRLKNLAVRLNKKAFDAQGQLIVGAQLRLPGAKMPEQAPTGAAKVGRVLISGGQMSAQREGGQRRVLQRGSALYEGDTLETSRGRSQIRFTDGSLVALRPNTQFKVEEYNYAGKQDGTEKGVYSLLRGGFRTISGAIGKLNKQNYSVRTPVATIGIRGTHYGLTLCDGGSCDADGLGDGLYGGVVDGAVVAQNNSGEKRFSNDEYFSIAGMDAVPKSLLAPPGVIFGEQPASGDKENKPSQSGKGKPASGKPRQAAARDPLAKQGLRQGIQRHLGGANPPLRNLPGVLTEIQSFAENNPVRLGVKAPANARVHSALLADDTRNIISGQLEDLRVAFRLGNGGLEGGDTGEIFISQGPNGEDILTFMKVGSTGSIGPTTVSLNRIFAPQNKITLRDIGRSTANGLDVSWGRWDNAVIRETALGKVHSIQTQDMHYLYSEDAIASKQGLMDLHASQQQPGMINLTPISGAGTKPTDLQGNVGAIMPSATNMQINLATGKLEQYNIGAQFGGGAMYQLGLENGPIDLHQAMTDDIKLQGTCSGGGACATSTVLNGRSTADFIVKGATVNAIAGFAAHNGDDNNGSATTGVTGTLLLSTNP